MTEISSRIVNVIQTSQGDEVQYFTLEGVLIGIFKGGTRKPLPDDAPPPAPGSGVITAPTPAEIKLEKERKTEKDMTAAGRLNHLTGKNDST
jgi:hypothetical protein